MKNIIALFIMLIIGCKEKPKDVQIIKMSGKDSGRWVSVDSNYYYDTKTHSGVYVFRLEKDSTKHDTIYIHDTIYKNKVTNIDNANTVNIGGDK